MRAWHFVKLGGIQCFIIKHHLTWTNTFIMTIKGEHVLIFHFLNLHVCLQAFLQLPNLYSLKIDEYLLSATGCQFKPPSHTSHYYAPRGPDISAWMFKGTAVSLTLAVTMFQHIYSPWRLARRMETHPGEPCSQIILSYWSYKLYGPYQ